MTNKLNLKYTTLTEVSDGNYEDANGNSIYKDEFFGYRIMVNGSPEVAPTLKKAAETMNNDRYWR